MSLSNPFPPWGRPGELPPSGFGFEGGDQLNEKYVNALFDQINKTFDEVIAEAIQRDGSVAMDANLDLGGNAITNIGDVDGVDVSTLDSDFSTHESDTSNPHSVTHTQVGAIEDAADTVSESNLDFDPATQTELDTHENDSDAHHSKYTDAEARTAVEGDVDAADLDGSSGTNGQILGTDGTDADWVTLGLNVRELYRVGLPTLARGDYFGDIYPGVLAATDFVTGTIISTAGTTIESFTTSVDIPIGVSVDPADGTLWTINYGTDTILHRERDGSTIDSFSSPGSGPRGISVDSADGTLWTADENSDTVHHLERDGTSIDSFTPPASANQAAAVDPADGTLWLVDLINDDIYHVERDGSTITSFSTPGSNAGPICVDPGDGTLWHSDTGSSGTIHNLDRDGSSISSFTPPGSNPRGITIDPADGSIWAGDEDAFGSDTIYHLNRFAEAYEVSVDGATFAMRKL